MSGRRRLALAAAGLAVLAIVGVGALVRVATARSAQLLSAAGKKLGRRVEADRFVVGLRGGIGVVLAGVRIADDPAFGDEPFVRASRLEMRLRLLPLLRGRIVVDRVVVDDPAVRILRDAKGRLNVDSLARRAKAEETAAAPPKHPRRPRFQLANLRLRNGTITYREQSDARGVDLLDLAVDAREPRFGAPIPVSVRGRFAGHDVRLDDVRSEGVVDLTAERPTYRGEVHGGPGAVGTMPIEHLDAHVSVSPPTLTLEGATMSVVLLRVL
jgi:uncharacterized protein involved in outer membrane biogenesis